MFTWADSLRQVILSGVGTMRDHKGLNVLSDLTLMSISGAERHHNTCKKILNDCKWLINGSCYKVKNSLYFDSRKSRSYSGYLRSFRILLSWIVERSRHEFYWWSVISNKFISSLDITADYEFGMGIRIPTRWSWKFRENIFKIRNQNFCYIQVIVFDPKAIYQKTSFLFLTISSW